MIAEMCRRLHHAPRVARRANATAFAGIGHEVVVPAVITLRPGKAVGKDATFEVFAKRLADIGLGGVVVALAVPADDESDALHDGAQARVAFAPPHTALPHQTMEVVSRGDGRPTLALARRHGTTPARQASLRDIATLDDERVPLNIRLFSFSSRRRAHAVYAVSRVRLDPDGRVTHMQWGRVDTTTNLWMGTELVVPVAEAGAALQAGDQVFALFTSPEGYLPGRQFTTVDYDEGRQTVVLHGDPKVGHEIRDMDRLTERLAGTVST